MSDRIQTLESLLSAAMIELSHIKKEKKVEEKRGVNEAAVNKAMQGIMLRKSIKKLKS